MHVDALRNHIGNQLRIEDENLQWYQNIFNFTARAHHLYLQLRQDP